MFARLSANSGSVGAALSVGSKTEGAWRDLHSAGMCYICAYLGSFIHMHVETFGGEKWGYRCLVPECEILINSVMPGTFQGWRDGSLSNVLTEQPRRLRTHVKIARYPDTHL